MSFFGGIKRVFGMSDDDADELEGYEFESGATKEPEAKNENNDVVNFSDNGEIPEGVFDGLIEVINSNLSPLVLKCLDVEAEKKYLYEALGPRFSDFVKTTREKSLSAAREEWDKEKLEMKKKIEDFKTRCTTAESEMNDMKAVKMSEDRQRLALKERVRKLEDRVAEVEAEKEQRDLENKSLLNRLKVLQVRNGDSDDVEKEIQSLLSQIEDLKKQLSEAETAQVVVDDSKNDELQAELEKAKADLATAQQELANATESLAMLDEIQAQLVLVEEFKKNKEEEITGLKERCASLEKEAQEAKKAVAESTQVQIDELKAEKEKACAELQQQISDLQREKANALFALKEETELREQIAQLELDAKASAEKMAALVQENSDTLEVLHKRDELVQEQKALLNENAESIESLKAELEEAKSQVTSLKEAYDKELNELKSAEATQVQKFQAEIAELQAKLNVKGELDDLLVDDDLRAAVEETFDAPVKDIDFDAFSTIEEDVAALEEGDGFIVRGASDAESKEVDNIDWLFPDNDELVETIIGNGVDGADDIIIIEEGIDSEIAEPKVDDLKSLFAEVEEEIPVKEEQKEDFKEKDNFIPDAQMSLFG